MPLRLEDVDPIVLDSYVDTNGKLQFRWGVVELSDHDDEVQAISDSSVEFRLMDPSTSSVDASHEDGLTTVNWSSISGGVSHTFGRNTPRTAVTATTEVTPPKMIYVRATPTGGL